MKIKLRTAASAILWGAAATLFCNASKTIAKAAPNATCAKSPSSTFAYVADFRKEGIAQFRVASNGALLPLAPARVPLGFATGQLSIDKAGRFAYAINPKAGTISHLSIGKDGTLTRRRVPDVKTGREHSFLLLDESRGMAYASASGGEAKVFRYALGKDGVLKALPSLLVPGAARVVAYPTKVQNANLLLVCYVLQADVQKYQDGRKAVEKLGYLEKAKAWRVLDSEVPVHYDLFSTAGTARPSKFQSLVVPGGGSLVLEPGAKFAYLTRAGAIDSYLVNPDGLLVLASTLAIPTGGRAVGINFDRSGRFVYVDHRDDQGHHFLSQFRRGNNGALLPLSPRHVATEGDVVNETLDPTGKFFYVTSVRNGNTLDRFVVTYRIGADGRLMRVGVGQTETGNNASLPQFDPMGRFAYIGIMLPHGVAKGAPDYDVLQFQVKPDGTLSPLSPPKVRMNYFWNMQFVKRSASGK